MEYRRIFDDKVFTEEEFNKEYEKNLISKSALKNAFECFTFEEVREHLDETFKSRIYAYAKQNILDNLFYEEEP